MGLIAQALIVFALSFGVCVWLLGRFFLTSSDRHVLRDQLLASGETAALEEQQEAIAAARAPVLRPVASGQEPPAAPAGAPAAPPGTAAEADAAGPAGKKKKQKGDSSIAEAAAPGAPTAPRAVAADDESVDSDEAGEDVEDEEDGVDESAEPFKEAKVAIRKFLEGSLSSFMKDGFELNAISKFGCHLFSAGAAEAIGRENELDNKEFIKILETSVSLLGSSKDVVRKFGEKYDEYLLDPS